MSQVQEPLARKSMSCAYDRANVGSSGTAPTPRTAAQIVTDLHQLLEKADVPGYVIGAVVQGSGIQVVA